MSSRKRTLLEQPTRRTFIERLALGCTGLLCVPAWQSAPAGQSPALLLARRIVRIIGAPLAVTSPKSVQSAAIGIEQPLAQLFDAPDFERLLTLDDAQLRQFISTRIQQQYQQDFCCLHQGWWLARGEVALLQLSGLLPEAQVAV